MKFKHILAASALAFGLAGTTFAQTKVFIAGAPAIRQPLTSAIEDYVATSTTPVGRAYNGTNLVTANCVVWTGITINNTPITIKLTYNGSAGGYAATAGNKTVRFLLDSVGTGEGKTDLLTGAGLNAAAEEAVPHFHIANEFQSSTPWIGQNDLAYATGGPTTYETLDDRISGILPLRLVASPAAPNDLNITPQLVRSLYTTIGGISLSLLTGRSADLNKKVYVLARGIDSGVRTLWATNNGLGTSVNNISYQATVSLTGGRGVAGAVLTSGGSGYNNVPGIAFGGSTRGSGYVSAPTVVFGGPGTGASLTPVLGTGPDAGRLVSVTVNSGGSGYTSASTITFNGGGATTNATVTNIGIVGGVITSVSIAGGAAGTATVSGGKVTAINVTNAGQGYVAAPSITITPAVADTTAKLAAATAVLAGGTTTSHVIYPAGNVIGVDYTTGNGGYPTFGPMLTALTSTLNLPGGSPEDIYLTVLSDADAQVAFAGGAKEVAWQGNKLGQLGTYGNIGGVINTPSPTGSSSPALSNGQYELWGYIRLASKSLTGVAGGVPLAVREAIHTRLRDTYNPVLLKDVNVQRSQPDGGSIQPGQVSVAP